MAYIPTSRDQSSPVFHPDAALADRFTRLAGETTGYTRKIMLKLADEAWARHLVSVILAETVDLQLVPRKPGSPPNAVREYS